MMIANVLFFLLARSPNFNLFSPRFLFTFRRDDDLGRARERQHKRKPTWKRIEFVDMETKTAKREPVSIGEIGNEEREWKIKKNGTAAVKASGIFRKK